MTHQPAAPARNFIPLSAPQFTEADIASVAATLQSGWVSTAAPVVRDFESAMAKWLDVPDAIALNSGTAALHLALRLAGVGQGDEVIVPALSFIATVNPVMYVGATPVFADVDPDTLGLSASTVLPCLTSKTKAIIVTHLFGLAAAMEPICALARERGIPVIEDAAEALGTTLQHASGEQRFVGSFGDFGCFSFNGNKTFTTGSGGLLVSKHPVEAHGNWPRRGRALSAQARVLNTEEIEHEAIGHNYRMNAMQAALGVSQLPRLDAMLRARRDIAFRYWQALHEAPGIEAVYWLDELNHGQWPSYWLSCMRLRDASQRLPLLRYAKEKGIELRPFFKPLPLLTPFLNSASARNAFPVAEQCWQHGVCLPSSHWLGQADQEYVIETIRNGLAQA